MGMRYQHLLALWFLLLPPMCWGEDPPPRIDVILWFDTEDYILPASDDAALRLATFLTKNRIQATFKVVGEKARVLEQRGRQDVIAALKHHEIGYHSNWHSIPPTPAQYLDACGWHDGVAEFTRREKPGYDHVERIFGQKPSCYGQPGSSWGPQSHASLYQWGMRIYLDAGQHINVDGKPFWYGGLLNFYRLTHQIRTGLNYPHELEDARIKFLRARDQLIADKGGVISIVYHPCEFVHQQFWDGVNFKHGANPPRLDWKLPAVKTDAERAQAYENFEQYILFMQRFPEVRFVTATQAADAYPDKGRQHAWTCDQLQKLAVAETARFEKEGIQWVKTPQGSLSAAELFWLFTQAAATPTNVLTSNNAGTVLPALPGLIAGPGRTPVGSAQRELLSIKPEDLLRSVADVKSYLETHHQIPAEVWVGSQAITPEAYLLHVMRWMEAGDAQRQGRAPAGRAITQVPRLQSASHVADDGPYLWKWVIFPPGFQAPNVMAQAKRQAWNLKPAERK